MTTIHLTEEMFSSGKPFAQGEVLIWMKKFAPKAVLERLANLKNMQEMPLENGQLILGHSETGHHHVLEPVRKEIHISKAAQALIDAANDSFVELKLSEPCKIVHLRDFDTHKAVVLPAGDYVRGIREEQSVQGWVRVAD
jgi:hypothetical protein